jgi:hypothetical protein
MTRKQTPDDYSEEEARQRFEQALKGAAKAPPPKKAKRQPKKSK